MSLGKAVKTALISAAACTAAVAVAVAATSVFCTKKFCATPEESTIVAVVDYISESIPPGRENVYTVPPTKDSYKAALSWCSCFIKTHLYHTDVHIQRVNACILSTTLYPIYADGHLGEGIECSFDNSGQGWKEFDFCRTDKGDKIYLRRLESAAMPRFDECDFYIVSIIRNSEDPWACHVINFPKLLFNTNDLKNIVKYGYGTNTLEPKNVNMYLYNPTIPYDPWR